MSESPGESSLGNCIGIWFLIYTFGKLFRHYIRRMEPYKENLGSVGVVVI